MSNIETSVFQWDNCYVIVLADLVCEPKPWLVVLVEDPGSINVEYPPANGIQLLNEPIISRFGNGSSLWGYDFESHFENNTAIHNNIVNAVGDIVKRIQDDGGVIVPRNLRYRMTERVEKHYEEVMEIFSDYCIFEEKYSNVTSNKEEPEPDDIRDRINREIVDAKGEYVQSLITTWLGALTKLPTEEVQRFNDALEDLISKIGYKKEVKIDYAKLLR